MLIEKELIQKAKEKLGDKNAELISEILNVEQYNERDRKGLCPFHSEKTPSFIYNAKAYAFKCFGCGKTVDLIDAYIEKGSTFIGACEKLFEEAGINYSFGEAGVKTKREYKYPEDPSIWTEPTETYNYLSKRKISKETADYLDIGQDEHDNMVFKYYDENDVLNMVKLRPSHRVEKPSPKTWCLPGADTRPILFNMNRINPQQPLLICCGELDAAACIEAGYKNAVSIPLGDGNTHWLSECYDWLEQFDSIILCADNDESGRKFLKTVTPSLGSWRVKVVSIPEYYEKENGDRIKIKDANECLYYFGNEKLLNLILNANDSPVPSLKKMGDVEEKDFSELDGIKTGIRELDKKIVKLFFGSLTIVSGLPGSGKSSFLSQLACNAADQGYSTFLFSREMADWFVKSWITHIFAGEKNTIRYEDENGASFYSVPRNIKERIDEYYGDKIFIYRDDYPNDAKSLEDAMTDSVRKFATKLIIIDDLMMVDLSAEAENRNQKETEFINFLTSFAIKYQVAIILVAHPNKGAIGLGEIGIYSIAGSSNISNLCQRMIGIRRVPQKEKQGVKNQRGEWTTEPNPFDVELSIIKDRYAGRSGIDVGMFYDEASRRFFTSYDEFNKNYDFDKENTIRAKMPRQLLEQNEVFGEVS